MTLPAQLLAHLDALYGFAQLVTPDADEAARLVRDTYARAFAALPAASHDTPQETKAWLFRLLLEERSDRGGHLPPLSERPDEAPDALAARRRAHAGVLVERLLPAALLALPTRTRLLLVLTDVEGLSLTDAAEVLGLPPETAETRHTEAHAELADHLRAAAAPYEGPLVEHVLAAPDGLRNAVTTLLARELEPVPPTLRPLIPVPEPVRATAPPFRLHRARRWWVGGPALVIALGVAAAFYFARSPRVLNETSLLELAAGDAEAVRPTLRSSETAQVERYVREQAGWRLALPQIDGYRLEGATVREITRGVNLPAFVYRGDGPRVVVYAVTYRLLDQGAGRIGLAADVLQQLEDERHLDVHDFGAEQAIVWRNRDDLFIAIATGDAEDLQRRIVR